MRKVTTKWGIITYWTNATIDPPAHFVPEVNWLAEDWYWYNAETDKTFYFNGQCWVVADGPRDYHAEDRLEALKCRSVMGYGD